MSHNYVTVHVTGTSALDITVARTPQIPVYSAKVCIINFLFPREAMATIVPDVIASNQPNSPAVSGKLTLVFDIHFNKKVRK